MWRIVLECAPLPASCRRHPLIMNNDSMLTGFICVSEVTRVRSARFLNLRKARLGVCPEPFPQSNGHTARNFKFFCIPWRSWLWSFIRMLWCSHASINHNLKGYIHKNQMYLHNLSIVLFGGLQPGWCLSLWFFYRSWVFCLPGGVRAERRRVPSCWSHLPTHRVHFNPLCPQHLLLLFSSTSADTLRWRHIRSD